ncbi:hypothetical protein V6N13_016887 [Hibiscus sabdariffa]
MPDASIGWKPSSSNRFNLRSAYDVRLEGLAPIPDKLWHSIHKRMQLTQDAGCPICHHLIEGVDHLLRLLLRFGSSWSYRESPTPTFYSRRSGDR